MRHGRKVEEISFKRRYSDGSITVEAAFILPLVIFMTFALLYLAFYLHDICRIQCAVDETLQEAGLTYKHEASLVTGSVRYEDISKEGVFDILTENTEQRKKDINYDILSDLAQGLLFSKINAVTVDIGRLSLSITVEVKTTISLPVFGALFERYSDTIISGSYPLHDPAELVRVSEVVLQTASKIKGVDELKKKLQDILPDKE